MRKATFFICSQDDAIFLCCLQVWSIQQIKTCFLLDVVRRVIWPSSSKHTLIHAPTLLVSKVLFFSPLTLKGTYTQSCNPACTANYLFFPQHNYCNKPHHFKLC